jgi:hypothetical protein
MAIMMYAPMYPAIKRAAYQNAVVDVLVHEVSKEIAAIFVVKGHGCTVVIRPKTKQPPETISRSFISFTH